MQFQSAAVQVYMILHAQRKIIAIKNTNYSSIIIIIIIVLLYLYTDNNIYVSPNVIAIVIAIL